jgi:hypothetical protein
LINVLVGSFTVEVMTETPENQPPEQGAKVTPIDARRRRPANVVDEAECTCHRAGKACGRELPLDLCRLAKGHDGDHKGVFERGASWRTATVECPYCAQPMQVSDWNFGFCLSCENRSVWLKDDILKWDDE